jgi:hypothetical protein
MPWVETEALFKSTLKAAIEVTSPHEGIPKDPKVVDLGEAGRQEVWQSGSRCIQKTIAKHGGKRNLFRNPGRATCQYSRQSFREFSVAQQRLASTPFHCLHQLYIQDAPQVSAWRSRPEQHAALGCLDPWFNHVVIDTMPRFPVPLVDSRANAARAQRNDAICAACSHNPATVRPRGASITRVAAW